jgi:hypothetical protein
MHTGFWSDARAHVKACGGPVVFTFKILRLLGCLALLSITIAVFIVTEEANTSGLDWLGDLKKGHHSKKRGGKKRNPANEWFSQAEWIQLALCVFYV